MKKRRLNFEQSKFAKRNKKNNASERRMKGFLLLFAKSFVT